MLPWAQHAYFKIINIGVVLLFYFFTRAQINLINCRFKTIGNVPGDKRFCYGEFFLSPKNPARSQAKIKPSFVGFFFSPRMYSQCIQYCDIYRIRIFSGSVCVRRKNRSPPLPSDNNLTLDVFSRASRTAQGCRPKRRPREREYENTLAQYVGGG